MSRADAAEHGTKVLSGEDPLRLSVQKYRLVVVRGPEIGATYPLDDQGEIRVGNRLRRVSTIRSVEEKSGGSGRLVFVTVEHLLEGPRGPVLREEQDIVYRGTEGAAVRAAEAAPDWPGAQRAESRGGGNFTGVGRRVT